MPKRLTDTDIWKNQRWFRKLSPEDKLAWLYIKDQCNHAGIWKIDCSDLMEDTGIKNFDINKFIISINKEFDKFSGKETTKERVRILNKNFLWVTGAIQFHQESKEGKVNAEANPVKTALEILSGFGVLEEALIKGYLTLTKGKQRVSKTNKTLAKGYINSNSNSNSINKESLKNNTVTTPEKKTWNKFPTKADFNGLPDNYVQNGIELVFRTSMKHISLDKDAVLGLWEVFKTQHLTGDNEYQNEGKVYSHFLSHLKYINFNNASKDTKLGTSAARSKANRDY